MQTTSGLLMYLSQRLGAAGITLVILLAAALAVALGLMALAAGEILAAGADPLQLAPVRWGGLRF